MKSFSVRKGIKPAADIIQMASMNDQLKNSLWNVLDVSIWSAEDFMYRQYGEASIEPFSKRLWFHYFKMPIDSRPDRHSGILAAVRKYFFSCDWNEVYDFLEFVVAERRTSTPRLAD